MNQHNDDKQHIQRHMQQYTSTCKGQTHDATQQKHEHSYGANNDDANHFFGTACMSIIRLGSAGPTQRTARKGASRHVELRSFVALVFDALASQQAEKLHCSVSFFSSLQQAKQLRRFQLRLCSKLSSFAVSPC